MTREPEVPRITRRIADSEETLIASGPGHEIGFKGMVDPQEVLDDIMDTDVTLKLGKIMGVSKDLQKSMGKMLKAKSPTSTDNVGKRTNYLASEFRESYLKLDQEFRRRWEQTDRGSLIEVWCVINKKAVKAIIDTGSEMNIINHSVLKALNPSVPYQVNPGVTMKDANNGESTLFGALPRVTFTIAGIPMYTKLYIKDNAPFDLLLGRPWQRHNLVSIDECVDGTWLIFKNNLGEPEHRFKVRSSQAQDDSDEETKTVFTLRHLVEEEDRYSDGDGDEYYSEYSELNHTDEDRMIEAAIQHSIDTTSDEETNREVAITREAELMVLEEEKEQEQYEYCMDMELDVRPESLEVPQAPAQASTICWKNDMVFEGDSAAGAEDEAQEIADKDLLLWLFDILDHEEHQQTRRDAKRQETYEENMGNRIVRPGWKHAIDWRRKNPQVTKQRRKERGDSLTRISMLTAPTALNVPGASYNNVGSAIEVRQAILAPISEEPEEVVDTQPPDWVWDRLLSQSVSDKRDHETEISKHLQPDDNGNQDSTTSKLKRKRSEQSLREKYLEQELTTVQSSLVEEYGNNSVLLDQEVEVPKLIEESLSESGDSSIATTEISVANIEDMEEGVTHEFVSFRTHQPIQLWPPVENTQLHLFAGGIYEAQLELWTDIFRAIHRTGIL